MRQQVTLRPGQHWAFTVGQRTTSLVVREASSDVFLSGDNLTTMQLSRADSLDISGYRSEELQWVNPGDDIVVFEFQLTDVPIQIKERLPAGNAVEISAPVTISKVNTPVEVTGTLAAASEVAASLQHRVVEIGATPVTVTPPAQWAHRILQVIIQVSGNHAVLLDGGLVIDAGSTLALAYKGTFTLALAPGAASGAAVSCAVVWMLRAG